MRIIKIKRAIALAVLLAAAVLIGPEYANGYAGGYAKGTADDSPSNEEIAFAQRASDLMLNELLAALFKEFDETTPDNVGEGKRAISLIFNDSNRDMRLIGIFPPLQGGFNDLPGDLFEQRSLGMALKGQPNTSVERVGGRWYYRRSVALSNTFHQACVLCHTNFTPQFFQQTNNSGQWVGALTLRVPIKNED
ncbi:MAG TPA: hypothetical protein VIC84_24710 [Blastocatellia bacterium]